MSIIYTEVPVLYMQLQENNIIMMAFRGRVSFVEMGYILIRGRGFTMVHILLVIIVLFVNSFSVLLRVFNASSADEISSSEVVSILQKVESLTSLHLAGVPLIEVKSSGIYMCICIEMNRNTV